MFRSLTPVVKNLIIINVLLFVGTAAWQPRVNLLAYADIASFMDLGYYALTAFPWDSKYFYPVQVVTNMFMHADLWHIFFNMLMLFYFGGIVERVMGPQRFLGFYLGCGIAGLLIFWLGGAAFGTLDPRIPVLGASGAVYGVLLSLAYIAPDMRIQLLIPPIPLKLGYLAIGLVAFDIFQAWTGSGGNTANFAHIGGAFFGLLLTMYWAKRGVIRA